MGHVVKHDRPLFPSLDDLTDLSNRLGMQNHALPEDDEFRIERLQKAAGCFDVNSKRIVTAYGKVLDRETFRFRVRGL